MLTRQQVHSQDRGTSVCDKRGKLSARRRKLVKLTAVTATVV